MPKKILLADDSITIQKVVELTFSEGDYQVTSVGNGAEALELITELQPDVALLDVIMPEVNGYEVCEKIKQDPSTAAIPVLLLTGTFEPFDRKRAEVAGANGHLTKPFESQMLITRVDDLIAASLPEGTGEDPEEIFEEPPSPEETPLHEQSAVEEDPYQARNVAIEEDDSPEETERSEASSPASESLHAVEPPVQEEEASPASSSADSEPDSEHQGIIPDRFDDQASRLPDREGEDRGDEGVRTIRVSSDEALPEGPVPVETASLENERGAEAWDELASGLATAPPAYPEAEEPMTSAPSLNTEAGLSGGGLLSSPSLEPSTVASQDAVPAPAGDTESPLPPVMSDSPAVQPVSGLSDADVERIAAKVVEQLSDNVIREISWEVIPELAETLIKRRIRELEEKISRES